MHTYTQTCTLCTYMYMYIYRDTETKEYVYIYITVQIWNIYIYIYEYILWVPNVLVGRRSDLSSLPDLQQMEGHDAPRANANACNWHGSGLQSPCFSGGVEEDHPIQAVGTNKCYRRIGREIIAQHQWGHVYIYICISTCTYIYAYMYVYIHCECPVCWRAGAMTSLQGQICGRWRALKPLHKCSHLQLGWGWSAMPSLQRSVSKNLIPAASTNKRCRPSGREIIALHRGGHP